MAFCFSDLQSEVARRATRDQSGGGYTTAIKNVINTSMWRVSREAKWRSLRRETTFNTKTSYSTGSGAVTVTNNSASVSVVGALFLTNAIRIGQYITISGSSKCYKIATITSETALTLDQLYDGANSTTSTYSILGQEEYILPIQIGHSAFFWHRAYGSPCKLTYTPTQEFYDSGIQDIITGVPVNYRMWGMSSALDQLKATSVIRISSSSASDTNISVTIYGIVSGYPDYETIITDGSDGTTPVLGLKTFTSVERIVKNQSTIGRITCTANSQNTTVSVLPAGNTTTGPYYTKIQLYPIPNAVIPINCFYYKLPYQLVNDNDVPELGEDFSEAIILLSVCKMNAEQNKKEDADFFKLYEDEIKSLKSTNVDKIDWAPTLQRPNQGISSIFTGGISPQQVGGNYSWGKW